MAAALAVVRRKLAWRILVLEWGLRERGAVAGSFVSGNDCFQGAERWREEVT